MNTTSQSNRGGRKPAGIVEISLWSWGHREIPPYVFQLKRSVFDQLENDARKRGMTWRGLLKKLVRDDITFARDLLKAA